MTLILLGQAYSGLGTADRSCILRNFTNAAGFLSYASGATIVASNGSASLSPKAYQWLGVIGLVVFSTIQMQDMADQPGDAARGRRTVPLVVGDGNARRMTVLMVLAWSLLAPAFWSLPLWGYIVPFSTALIISKRILRNRSVLEDKVTFKIWNIWITALYFLPLMKAYS